MTTARRPAYESEPQVNYLTQVLDEVHHGLIRVPRFQRPFVWTDEQRLELFRSVMDGTPIGSVMVWRTNLDIPCFERLGPHRLPAKPSASTPRTYLLDGHQRLSTLYAALYPPDSNLEYDEEQDALSGWQVYYDLDEGEFKLGSSATQAAWFMPLHVVLDTRSHFGFLRNLDRYLKSNTPPKRDDQLVDRADGIAKAIREYKIAVIPVVSDDIDSVTRTFQRINSQGTSMSDVHMISALTFGNEFDLRARLSEAQISLREKNWDADEKTLLQVLKVVVDADLYDAGIDDVAALIKGGGEVIIEEAVRLLAEAGRLLASWGVVAPEVVPYAHQPVLLAAAARASGGTVDPDLAEKLRRWFWLTSFFGDANASRIQSEHKRVIRLAEGIAPDFEDLRTEPLPWRFDFRHARIKAMLHLLAQLNPRGLDGDVVEAESLLARFGHKAVGRIITDRQRSAMSNPTRALSSGPENVFIVHPDQVTSVRNRLRKETDESWLSSHLIDSTAAERLRSGDLSGFLESRARAIQDLEGNFIKQLDGPEYRRRPTTLPGGAEGT